MSVSDAIKEWLKFKNSLGVSCVYNMLSLQRLSPFDLFAGERLFSLQISVLMGSKNFAFLLTFVIRLSTKKIYFILFFFIKKNICYTWLAIKHCATWKIKTNFYYAQNALVAQMHLILMFVMRNNFLRYLKKKENCIIMQNVNYWSSWSRDLIFLVWWNLPFSIYYEMHVRPLCKTKRNNCSPLNPFWKMWKILIWTSESVSLEN